MELVRAVDCACEDVQSPCLSAWKRILHSGGCEECVSASGSSSSGIIAAGKSGTDDGRSDVGADFGNGTAAENGAEKRIIR